MFEFFKPKIEGEIGYYNLQDWWLNTFSKTERKTIESKYGSITSKKKYESSISSSEFLWTLSTWFSASTRRDIGKRIITKACEEARRSQSIWDLHFALSMAINIFNDEENRIKFSKEQIEISPQVVITFKKREGFFPAAHAGYEKLAIILERQKKFEDAIKICQQAKDQGWNGDWDKRIERIKRKTSVNQHYFV